MGEVQLSACKTILAEREECTRACVVLKELLTQEIPGDCWATSQQSLLQDQNPTSLNCSLVGNLLKKGFWEGKHMID